MVVIKSPYKKPTVVHNGVLAAALREKITVSERNS